ncbi:MAG: hypothetical protein E6H99_08145 [Chloroflexi bacterium]|nr:MAG: hypothetical protein E6I13_02325 [Chloroflexota bacterium]TMG20629.1 MAG: hypothetical protein E6H99_08145 [Chloroflexota bacterium]TMG67348.1 MAG: hypothetical protein E6H82_05240 [Chloroflexota bacterium]
MNWAVLRREWGAVTFVLTVIAGMIVVPLALYFANQGPGPVAAPSLTTTSSARASSVTSPTPTPSASPSASPSVSPSP